MRKKTKRQETLLLTNIESVTEEEALMTVKEIAENLIIIFRNHIGEENAIKPVELFENVYGRNPFNMNIFEKEYWWNILKNILRHLRNQDKLFVINKGSKLFVLKTTQEATDFKKKIDLSIVKMQEIKKRADSWTRNKKWRGI